MAKLKEIIRISWVQDLLTLIAFLAICFLAFEILYLGIL